MKPGLLSYFQGTALCIGVATVILCVFPRTILAGNTKIYRWVDPVDHSVHFSQTPPTDAAYKEVKVTPTPPPDAGVQKHLKEMEKTVDEGIKSQEQTAQKQKQLAEKEAARKQQCKQLKERLNLLETRPGKLLYKDKSGQMTRMTEERRQKNIASFKQQIEKVCSPKR